MTEAYDWRGRTVLDAEGEKLGTIDEIYLDRTTGHFAWMLVHTGLCGSRSHFVPLAGASGKDLRANVSKEQVKGAPSVEPGGKLSQNEERRLSEHYGVPYERGRQSGTSVAWANASWRPDARAPTKS